MSTYIYNGRKNPICTDNLPTPDFVKEYLNYIWVVEGKTPGTVMNYYISVQSFLKWKYSVSGKEDDTMIPCELPENTDMSFLSGITDEDIRSYLSYCGDEMENRECAISSKLSALYSFFRYYTEVNCYLTYNPAEGVEFPKREVKVPRALTEDETAKLLRVSAYGENPCRNRCIVTMLLMCGLRPGELVNINIPDIEEDILTVTGKRHREIRLNDAVLDALGKWTEERKQCCFADEKALFITDQTGRRITVRAVQKMLQKVFTAAGLADRKYSAHDLRHTAAVRMMKYQTDDMTEISAFLGNTSNKATNNYRRAV